MTETDPSQQELDTALRLAKQYLAMPETDTGWMSTITVHQMIYDLALLLRAHRREIQNVLVEKFTDQIFGEGNDE